MKKIIKILFLILVVSTLSGCFLTDKVKENQTNFENEHDEIFNIDKGE